MGGQGCTPIQSQSWKPIDGDGRLLGKAGERLFADTIERLHKSTNEASRPGPCGHRLNQHSVVLGADVRPHLDARPA